MNIFTQFFKKNSGDGNQVYQEIIRDLLRREAEIGGGLFGEVHRGATRKFFQLEKNTWIWVEQFTKNGKVTSKTTKYIIKPTELIKSVNGAHYEITSLQEARNFEMAVRLYVQEVDKQLYSGKIAASA